MNKNIRKTIRANIQAENALRDSEDRLNKTQEISHVGSWEHNLVNNSTYWSDETFRIYGYKPREVIPSSKYFNKVLHPDEIEKTSNLYFNSVKANKNGYTNIFKIFKKSTGEPRLIYEKCEHIRDKSGKIIRSVGMIQDITERKLMEEALKESERRLNKSQEIAHLGSWELDLTKNKLTWSDETYRIFGLKPQEFTATYGAFLEAVHPDDRKAVDKAYSDSLKEGRDSYEIEHRVIKKSTGEIRVVYEKCAHIRDKSGKILRSVGMVQDITQRKRAEEKIVASETRYRRLFESAKDGILILNAQTGMIVDVNPFLIRLLGLSHKILLGKKVWELGFFKDIVASQDKFIELQQKQYIRYEDIALRTADGRRIDVEFVSNVYQVDHLKVIQCNIRDITERKRAEKALLENEEKFRSVAETAKDAIVSANSRGKIIYLNKGAEMIFGYTVSEAVDKPLTILMPKQLRESHLSGFSRFLTTGKPHAIGKTIEMTGIKKNGDEFPIELSLANWTVGNENFFTAIIRDITERKNLDQRKDDFITIAGHELRTPVSAIKIINQILHDMLADNPQVLEYLEKIDRQTTLQANLINDLLNVSKIQTGKLEIRRETFKPQDLVKEVVENMQKTVKTHKLIIRGNIHGKIFADREKIGQVLTNFCSNAIKFSPEGKKVIFKLNDSKKDIVVGVKDNGIGISKEHKNRVFERFYRVYGSGNKTFPGLGMGLYISYQIIKLHNGKTWFESKPGKGSTFYFSLPKV